MAQKPPSLTDTIKSNPLAWIVQAVGIIVVVLNLWLAYQLTPISKNIDSLIYRVGAIESRNDRSDSDHEDIQVIKEQINIIRQDVVSIKNHLNVR